MRSVRPARPALPRAITLVVTVAAGCTGQTHVLGDKAPRPYHFETPQVVLELTSLFRTDNPTLTADLLEIYFTSERNGDGDVWSARRASLSDPFGAPTPIAELNTAVFETSSAISADGLTLWFGSDRPAGVGSTDIWMSSRPDRTAAWSPPQNAAALNTTAEDIPRPPGQHGAVMPLSSKRATAAVYQTFLAVRVGSGTTFGGPALIAELVSADRSTVDGFLTEDGLTLFYSSSPLQFLGDAGPIIEGTADLFVASRRSVDDAFERTQALDDLNTSGDERDPWLTPDGKTLYFTSDRGGALNIYTAAVKPR